MENTQNIVLGVEVNYQYKMDILLQLEGTVVKNLESEIKKNH